MDPKLTYRFVRSLAGVSLAVVWFMVACQLPEKLVATIVRAKPTGTSVSLLTSTSVPPGGTPYPGSAIQTPLPGTSFSGAYPSSGLTQPASTELSQNTTELAYPGSGGQDTVTITPTSVQTSPSGETVNPLQDTTYPGPAQANFTEVALTLTAVAYPDSSIEGPSAPGQTSTQTSTGPYPGVSTPTPSPTNSQAYPGAATSSPTASGVTRTFTSTPTGQRTSTLNASITPTSSAVLFSSPTSSSTPVLATTPTPSPSATQFVIPTATPTFTRTPFLTPTPTLTRTPTLTPTPLPAPPWVSSQLHATDPRTVRLASGRVQLIEFFAFWSGTSQAMAPIIHGLEDQYGLRMNFIYLDIDDPANSYFKSELGFRQEPQFFLLDPQGKILRQWIGYVNREQFISAFNAALGQ